MLIEKVWFDKDYIFIKTDLRHISGDPLSWFPVLNNATTQQRNNFETWYYGINSPGLDEDLGMNGFFNYKKDTSLAQVYTFQIYFIPKP